MKLTISGTDYQIEALGKALFSGEKKLQPYPSYPVRLMNELTPVNISNGMLLYDYMVKRYPDALLDNGQFIFAKLEDLIYENRNNKPVEVSSSNLDIALELYNYLKARFPKAFKENEVDYQLLFNLIADHIFSTNLSLPTEVDDSTDSTNVDGKHPAADF